jgi:hypothetical protein
MLILFACLTFGCDVIDSFLRGFDRYCAAAEWVVNRTADDSRGTFCSASDCSLRKAVNTSNACPGIQTIRIPAGTYVLTLTDRSGWEDDNLSGDLDITDSVHIVGEGRPIIDGNRAGGVFHIAEGATVNMTGLVVRNGYNQTGINNQGALVAYDLVIQENGGEFGRGGGLSNSGSVTISHSAIVNNNGYDRDAYEGGGVKNSGSLLMENVTVSGNQGCGMLNGGRAKIVFSTFANNQTHCQIGNLGGVEISNSIISGGGLLGNCWGSLTSLGFNIDNARSGGVYDCGLWTAADITGEDPRIWPLGGYGSTTLVHALDPASRAVDSADPTQCGRSAPFGASDQRGVSRPQGSLELCDRGAFELEPAGR